MSHLNYVLGRVVTRVIRALVVKSPTLHRERFDLPGGFIVAPTHESHLEPILLSTVVDRKIDWMARLEFYKYSWSRWLLARFDAFPVNRFGVPVRAIRTAIHRLGKGRVIGIFPEGGVARGQNACTRGGRIKLGCCLIAVHADVPIVPVVMVGTYVLTRIAPWLPFRRATVWFNYGQPIYPPKGMSRRQARLAMGEQLRRAYIELYRELCETYGLNDSPVPRSSGSCMAQSNVEN
jgi:1-acyl-sn-glycerol-3-phosphate acyltransferase